MSSSKDPSHIHPSSSAAEDSKPPPSELELLNKELNDLNAPSSSGALEKSALEGKDPYHSLKHSLNHFIVHKISTSSAAGAASVGDEDVDQNYQFYKEYCRLYYANIILTNRLQQLLNEKQELQFKLNRLEVLKIFFILASLVQ